MPEGSGKTTRSTAPPPPVGDGTVDYVQQEQDEFEAAAERVRARMAALGHPVKIISRRRSALTQAGLYAQSRTRPGPKITNADGINTLSNHQRGLAADFVFSGRKQPWELLGKVAKEEGLRWGGDWDTPKGPPNKPVKLVDQGHVETRRPALHLDEGTDPYAKTAADRDVLSGVRSLTNPPFPKTKAPGAARAGGGNAKPSDAAVSRHLPPAAAQPSKAAAPAKSTPPEQTKLSPEEEVAFQDWARESGITDVDHPLSHYDYRGYWKSVGGMVQESTPGRHFPDTFKQHGHPTFSEESQYSKGPGDGGRWEGETFVPPGGKPQQPAPVAATAPAPAPAPAARAPLPGPTPSAPPEPVPDLPPGVEVAVPPEAAPPRRLPGARMYAAPGHEAPFEATTPAELQAKLPKPPRPRLKDAPIGGSGYHSQYTPRDLAAATRKAYPGEFDTTPDEDLAGAVHKAYPDQFSPDSNPTSGLEMLLPPTGPPPDSPATARAKKAGIKVTPSPPVSDIPPPPTTIGSEAYVPGGPELAGIQGFLSSVPGADLLLQGYDALTQAVVGRPAQASDILQGPAAGMRFGYGATHALAEAGGSANPMDLLPDLVNAIPGAVSSGMEEAYRGTTDVGTAMKEATEPFMPAAETAGGMLYGGKVGELGMDAGREAAALILQTATDPLTPALAGAPKFVKYLAGYVSGKNAINAAIRTGVEALAADLPNVEARAAAAAAEAPFRGNPQTQLRGGALYEKAARMEGTIPIPGVRPGVEAPPAVGEQTIGPERQLRPRTIYGLEPGQVPPDQGGGGGLGSSAGDERVGRPNPPEPGPGPLYTEPPPPYAGEPTIEALGDALGDQLERQPVGPGRLYGKPGFRLTSPPPPVNQAGVEAGTTAGQQPSMFRNRPRKAPEVQGRVEVRGPEEAPYVGETGQEAVPGLREGEGDLLDRPGWTGNETRVPPRPETISTPDLPETPPRPAAPPRGSSSSVMSAFKNKLRAWKRKVSAINQKFRSHPSWAKKEDAESFWKYLDAAREEGFEGTDQEFSNLYRKAMKEGQEEGVRIESDEADAAIGEHGGGSPRDAAIRFLQKIADLGGLHYDPKSPERGEMAKMMQEFGGVHPNGKRYLPEARMSEVKGAIVRYYKPESQFKQAARRGFAKNLGKVIKSDKPALSFEGMAEALHEAGYLDEYSGNELIRKLTDEIVPNLHNYKSDLRSTLDRGLEYLDIGPRTRWWDAEHARWSHPDRPPAEWETEGTFTEPGDASFNPAEIEKGPPQYGPPTRGEATVGQPPLGDTNSPRYMWESVKKKLLEERGSLQVPTREDWEKFGGRVSSRAARLAEWLNQSGALRDAEDTGKALTPPQAAKALRLGETISREAAILRKDLLAGGLAPDGPERVRQLELLSTDEAMGVRYDGGQQSHWGKPDEESTTICTLCARRVLSFLPEKPNTYIAGWDDYNTAARKVAADGGHDFAIYDGRYLIDPWAKSVETSSPRAAWDLANPADRAEVRDLYGDPAHWTGIDEGNKPVPKALVDLVNSEAQPSIPGLEEVRGTEVPTPQEELPEQTFTLEPPPVKPPKKGPGLFDTLKSERGGVDFNYDDLQKVMRTVSPETASIAKFLKGARKAFKNEEWYQRASRLFNEGRPMEAHREILLAQRAYAKQLAGITAREFGGERGQARQTAADLREAARAVASSPTPPWAAEGVREVSVVPKEYAESGEEGISTLLPPRLGPLPDIQQVDRVLGNQPMSDALGALTDEGVFKGMQQPYSIETGKPWRRESELRFFSRLADKILRSENIQSLRALRSGGHVLPTEQFVRWFKAKYSAHGRALGELGNLQQSLMKDRIISKTFIEPRFEGVAGGAPEPGELEAMADLARAEGQIGPDLAAQQGRREPTPELIAKTGPDYLGKDLLWGETGGSERYSPGFEDRARTPTFGAVENLGRALLVSQLSNGIRNLWVFAKIYHTGILEEGMASVVAAIRGNPESSMRHWNLARRMLETPWVGSGIGNVRPWTDSLEAMYSFSADTLQTAAGSKLSTRDVRRSLAMMARQARKSETAQALALKYMGNAGGLGEEEVAALQKGGKITRAILSPKFRNIMTTFNRVQEFPTRSVAFDATFRASLDSMGFDSTKLLAGNDFSAVAAEIGSEKLDDAIRAATHRALNLTLAGDAYPGSLPDEITRMFSKFPLFRTGYPFPKFNLVTAARYLYDRSPLAFADILPQALYSMSGPEGWRSFLPQRPIGRLAKGMAASRLQYHTMPQLRFQRDAMQSLQDEAFTEFKARTMQARSLAKEFRKLERQHMRTVSQPPLPGAAAASVDPKLTEIGEQLGAIYEAQDAAKARMLRARLGVAKAEKSIRATQSTIGKAVAVDAPDIDKFAGNIAGGMLASLGAAWVIRSSPGAKGTEWYQYRVKLPEAMGGGEHNVDFRPYAPDAQFMFVADVLEDIRTKTDWDQYHKILNNTDPENDRQYNVHNPMDKWAALTQSYDGKYAQDTKFRDDFLSAFVSISRAGGMTQSMLDLFTGRKTSEGFADTLYKTVIGGIGQFLGRYTFPARMAVEAQSIVDPEASHIKVPRGSTTPQLLLDPAISNIPGARNLIPDKISSVTGEPLAQEYPALHQLAGVSLQHRNEIEATMRDLGLSFAVASPRQTGDRELDNKIATAYSSILREVWPDLRDDPDVQGLPLTARRGVYKSVFSGLKGAAVGQVIDDLEKQWVSDEDIQKKVGKTSDLRKRQYWARLLRKMEAADAAAEGPESSTVPPPPGLNITMGDEGDTAPPPDESQPFVAPPPQ